MPQRVDGPVSMQAVGKSKLTCSRHLVQVPTLGVSHALLGGRSPAAPNRDNFVRAADNSLGARIHLTIGSGSLLHSSEVYILYREVDSPEAAPLEDIRAKNSIS